MTRHDDLAFPIEFPDETETGLSKREYITIHIARAFINPSTTKHAFPAVAAAAVAMADELIAALNK